MDGPYGLETYVEVTLVSGKHRQAWVRRNRIEYTAKAFSNIRLKGLERIAEDMAEIARDMFLSIDTGFIYPIEFDKDGKKKVGMYKLKKGYRIE